MSKDAFYEFKSDQRLPAKRKRPEPEPGPEPEPEPCCVSLKSDMSKDAFYEFKSDQRLPAKRLYQQSSEVPSAPSAQQHQTELDFMLLEENIVTFVKKELKKIQKVLSLEESLECQWEDEGEDEEQIKSSREALVKITMNFLRRMKQEGMADRLQSRTGAGNCQRKLKSNLKMKFQCVFEGIAKAGNPSLLNQIYTELYITEGGTGEVNDEHEVRQIERTSRKPHRPETTIRQEDILKPSPERDQPIRTVMTKGVAGIGKTVLTQKFTLDWAEGKAHQNIQFIFPFTFRELNVLKEKKFSLVELVHRFFTETKEICNFEDFQVLFIKDGLDESRLPLDFTNNEVLTDVTESTSVDVLLINLIRGKLLPSALLWITTRPAAANQIPPQCVDRITEVRGFTDQQKEEYFRKRCRDKEQASKIISHIRTSRSLHIMCHIPVFCWVAAAVLEVLEVEKRGELPKTLTQMYIYFLVFQINMRKTKYDRASVADPHWSPESRKIIVSLAKLAFDQLQKRNAIFYESHLLECGIDVRAASVYSGVFTEIFKEETGLHQKKVFCFVHLSVQEFLAALHVHLTFINSGINLMEEQSTSWRTETREDESAETDIYRSAVDKALQSSDGHLDLFLRFFMGLSVQNNQRLLEGLLRQTPCCSNTNQETVQYVKKKISENLQAEKSINLFHCLNELNDRSLMEEIQRSLDSGSLSPERLSPAQWSALAFILTSSEQSLDTFDLKKYSASEVTFLRLLPVVKQSKKAILSHCNLSDRSCETLSSVLGSYSSSLTELNLSNNNLKDSGVFLLCSGLESQDCALEILSLSSCNLSGTSCKHLSSVLWSQSSRLTDLDLTNNDLSDSGVNLLSAGLASPHCKLQTLSLSGCLITEEGCAFLATALSSNPSHLRDLDLSYNHPGEDGEKLMTARLEDGRSRLETLRMDPAGVQYLKPGLRKYSRRLVFDRNTMHRNLKLSEDNRKVTHVEEDQQYSDHPDRFDCCRQLLCRDALIGRCYWEVERKGRVHVSVTYRGIGRKGDSDLCELGYNEKSWSLFCSDGIYSVYHNNKGTSVSLNSISSSSSSSSVTSRVAVYLDHPAGLLSFYRVSSDSLIHIHTFSTSFSEPLHPGFGVGFRPGSSVSLCMV